MMKQVWPVLAFSLALLPGVAAAQEAAYLDDRSSAEKLVQSLYNAIARKEYARAWDYFGEPKPSADFAVFVQGYAKTGNVTVQTGQASEEGAAGSIFYQVPVAIKAVDSDGKEATFAGCYTARLAQPANQEPPFRPLQLEKGTLKPAEGELSAILPASCGDGPAPERRDNGRLAIEAAFKATYGASCQTLETDAEPGAADPKIHELAFRYASQTEDEPDRKARLFGFSCGYGAYNTTEVYYLEDDTGEFRQLQFAEPELDIRYEGDNSDGKLESVSVIGYRTTDLLVNSEFDPQAKTLQSFAKWRGVGDASTVGLWLFRGGTFSLTKYDVDASYDGEINHETVLDYDTAP